MESLANEIIVHIFNYLTTYVTGLDGPAQDTATFYRLCLVSRRFNQIATPFLFETYEHHATPSAPSKLLRTLAQCPILAENIKIIRQRATFKRSEDEYPLIDGEMVQSMSKKLKLPESANLDWRLNDTGDDLELAMLLFQASNLKRLYIRTWKHKLNTEPAWQMPLWVIALTRVAFGDSFGNIHRFLVLSHLYLDVHQIEATSLFPVFTMPSLVELTICHWGEMEGYEEDPKLVYGRQWRWPVEENKIEHLIFKLPFVSSRTMSNAIRSCKNLRFFEVHEESLEFQSNDSNWYSGLSAALVAQRVSLEELRITDTYKLEHSNDFGTLNMLHELIHLKVLKIPFYILVGPEGSKLNNPENGNILLPPTIEKLILLYEEDTVADHSSKYFQTLQSACAHGRLPYLNTIQLRCRFTCRFTHDVLPINIWDTDALFRSYGVTLEYYVQLCIWIRRRQLSDWRREDVPISEDLVVVQEWTTRFKHLPNLIRLEREGRNIVATNFVATKTHEDKKYEKKNPFDLRWRLY